MGLLDRWRKTKKQEVPLTTLCDQYMTLIAPYEHSQNEVRQLESRLCKLMLKRHIMRIARKDSLLSLECLSKYWHIRTSLLDRLGDDSYDENALGANLIPLVDRYLEAVAMKWRNHDAKQKVGLLIAKTAQARRPLDPYGYPAYHGSFVYKGYEFRWNLSHGRTSASVFVYEITDLDG